MWVKMLLASFLCSALLVYGIDGQHPFDKACEELENDVKFSEVEGLPFNVAVIYEEALNSTSNTSYYGCAGVLIAKKFILTAGHCVKDLKSIAVLLGLPQRYDVKGRSTSIYMPVKTINLHPDFKSGSYSNDIAVLELENEVGFTKDIYPICLQTATNDLDENTTLFGSGIKRDENRKLVTNVLLNGSAMIGSSAKCNETFGKIDDVQLCVMDSAAICETISGSALVIVTKDTKTGKYKQRLVGIKIAGFPCFHNKLRIYTKITAHLDFIENIIWPKT